VASELGVQAPVRVYFDATAAEGTRVRRNAVHVIPTSGTETYECCVHYEDDDRVLGVGGATVVRRDTIKVGMTGQNVNMTIKRSRERALEMLEREDLPGCDRFDERCRLVVGRVIRGLYGEKNACADKVKWYEHHERSCGTRSDLLIV
jgi:hypothetical protein